MIKLPDMEKFTHGLWPHAVAAIEAYSAEVQRLNATAQFLRPVELPEFVYDPEGEPFLHRDEVVELLRSLGHEVKS